MKTGKVIFESTSALFSLLWSYASVSKLVTFKSFTEQLTKSPFLTSMVDLVAYFIPLFELLLAILLVLPATRLLGLYLSFFLMLLFSGYIYLMLYHSFYIPCSCGGILNSMSWEQHLIFNIILTLIALIAISLSSNTDVSKHQNKKTFFAQKNRIS